MFTSERAARLLLTGVSRRSTRGPGRGKRRLADILLRQIRVAIVKGHKGSTQFATYEWPKTRKRQNASPDEGIHGCRTFRARHNRTSQRSVLPASGLRLRLWLWLSLPAAAGLRLWLSLSDMEWMPSGLDSARWKLRSVSGTAWARRSPWGALLVAVIPTRGPGNTATLAQVASWLRPTEAAGSGGPSLSSGTAKCSVERWAGTQTKRSGPPFWGPLVWWHCCTTHQYRNALAIRWVLCDSQQTFESYATHSIFVPEYQCELCETLRECCGSVLPQ